MKFIILLMISFLIIPCFAIPNPASVNCIRKHFYRLMLFDAGGWSGFCVFPDHSYCDEWEYFRGQCKPRMFYWPEKYIDYMHPEKYCLVLNREKHIIVMRCKTSQEKPGFINSPPPKGF
jgi:Domain of unknown function (DUF333)